MSDDTGDETATAHEKAPHLPVQRTPREETIRRAREEYADRAKQQDLAAILAPYHR